jgi:WD40 repeat protein
MKSHFSSSGTYSSPVKREDYDRRWKTEQRGKKRKGKRRNIFGGAKGTLERTVMPLFTKGLTKVGKPLILDPETAARQQLQNGISADGIPIKQFLPNKTFHVRPYGRAKRREQAATLLISNTVDPAVEVVNRRKKISKSLSMPKISTLDSLYPNKWTKISYKAAPKDLVGPHTNLDIFQQRLGQPNKYKLQKQIQEKQSDNASIREQYHPRGQKPIDEIINYEELLQNSEKNEINNNNNKTISEIYSEAHMHAKGHAEYPFEPDVDEAKLLKMFLQRKRRASCPLLPIVPAAPGKYEMPNVPNDAFFLIQALNNRNALRSGAKKRLDNKTRKAVEAINLFSRNEQRRGTANVATYSSRRIFGIGEYKKILSPINRSDNNEEVSTTFMTKNKLALHASLSGSDILNIDGQEVIVPKRSSTAPLSAPRSEMSLSVSITTKKGSESISQGEIEDANSDSQIFINSFDDNSSLKDRNIYIYISSSDQKSNSKELNSLFTNILPTLNHRLKELKIHLHPIFLRFSNITEIPQKYDDNKDASTLKLCLDEVKESAIVIALRGSHDTTKSSNPVEGFSSTDTYMNHFVSSILSSATPSTDIDIELKYAMDLGKYIFAYRKDEDLDNLDESKNRNSSGREDSLDTTLRSYSLCRFSTYHCKNNIDEELRAFEIKIIEDIYHKVTHLFDIPEKNPCLIEKDIQDKFALDKGINSFQSEQNYLYIEQLEAANSDKPTMILGDPESGRSSCATSIYKYFKDKNEKYASIFFSSQASKLSGSIDQMLRYLIFQILSEDGEKTSSKILRGDISTLKLFFAIAIERLSKKLSIRGQKLVLIIDGLDYFSDEKGHAVTIADWLPRRMPSNVLMVLTSDKDSKVTNWVYEWFADKVYTFLTEDVRLLSNNGIDILQNILKIRDIKWKASDITLLRKTVDTTSSKRLLSYVRLIDELTKRTDRGEKRKDIIRKMPRRSIELGFEIISTITMRLGQYLLASNIKHIIIKAFEKASINLGDKNEEKTLPSYIIKQTLGAIYVSKNGLEIDEILRVLFTHDNVNVQERVSGKRIIRWIKKELDYFIPGWNGLQLALVTPCYKITSALLNQTVKKLYASSFQSQAYHYNNLSRAMETLKYENDAVVSAQYLLDLPFYHLMAYNITNVSNAVCSIEFINRCMIEDAEQKIGLVFQDIALKKYSEIIEKMSTTMYRKHAVTVLANRDRYNFQLNKFNKSTINLEIDNVLHNILQYLAYFQSWIAHNGTNNKDHMELFALNFPIDSPIYAEASAFVESLGEESRKYLYRWVNKPMKNAISRSIFTISISEIVSFHTTPRSNLFVTGHSNGHLFMFDKYSGEKIQSFVFDGHRNPVRYVFMLHFGMFVASVSENTLILWETSSATTLEKINIKKNITVSCCSNTGNVGGLVLITCTYEGEIICWYLDVNPAEGCNFLRRTEFSSVGESSAISSVAISPNSKYVGVGLANGFVQVWEVLTSGLKFKTKFLLQNQTYAKVISFNPTSDIILLGGHLCGSIYAYDIDGRHISNGVGHVGAVTSVSWAEDKKHIVSSGSDGKTLLWNVDTYKCSGIVDHYHDAILSSSYVMPANDVNSNDLRDDKCVSKTATKISRILIVGNCSVKLVNMQPDGQRDRDNGKHITIHRSTKTPIGCDSSLQNPQAKFKVPILDNLSFRLHQSKVTCATFSYNSSRILSGCALGNVNIWSYENAEFLNILSSQINDPVSVVKFSPRDKFIVAGFNKGTIYLWDGETYSFLREFEWHTSKITSIAFSKSNEFFISGSVTGVLQSWKSKSGRFAKYASKVDNTSDADAIKNDESNTEISLLNNMHKYSVELLILTHDEANVISCCKTGEIRIFSVETLELIYVNTDFQNLKGYDQVLFREKSLCIVCFIDGRMRTLNIKELMHSSEDMKNLWHEDLQLQKGISTIKNEIYLRFKSLTDDISKLEKATLLEHVESSVEKLRFRMDPLVDKDVMGSFVNGDIVDVCNQSSICIFTPTTTTVCVKQIESDAIFPIFESYGAVQVTCFHPKDSSIVMVGDAEGNVYILRNRISAYDELDEPVIE